MNKKQDEGDGVIAFNFYLLLAFELTSPLKIRMIGINLYQLIIPKPGNLLVEVFRATSQIERRFLSRSLGCWREMPWNSTYY